jgi:plasmid maintenance system antidote protein VapI
MNKSATSPTSELLRQLIRDTGESVNHLARASGVAQPVLHRFVAGEQGLTLRNADKLFVFFGLEVRQRNGRRGRNKTAGRDAANAPEPA